MGLDTDGIFRFDGLDGKDYVELHLSNTERDMLRAHASEGGPLWKIQRMMLDYKGELERQLGTVDFATEEGIRHALRVQAGIKALLWQHDMWVRLLSPIPNEEGPR